MKVSFEVAYKAWLAGRSVRLMYEGARPRDCEETRKYKTGIIPDGVDFLHYVWAWQFFMNKRPIFYLEPYSR